MIHSIVEYGIPLVILTMVTGGFAFLRRRGRWSMALTGLFLIIAVGMGILAFLSGYDFVEFGIFRINGFSSMLLSFFAIALLLVLVLAKDEEEPGLFNMLFCLIASGAFFVVLSYSLLSLMMAIELISAATALMILKGGKKRIEPAVKLFVISTVAISVFVFAVAMIMPYDLGFAIAPLQMNTGLTGSSLIMLAAALFIVALAVEAGLFPFNIWMADVYQGAQGHVTALLSGVNKKIAFIAILYIFFVVFAGYTKILSPLFELIAILTMFFGNLVAMVQKDVKRMLAYSSISQAGYILIGIAVGTTLGLDASLFQIIAHTFMTIGAFGIVMWLGSRGINTVEDYKGLFQRNGFVGVAFALLLLSMAGVPPLMGFVGKFLLFSSAISSGLIALAAIGIINSFISIYYYGKVIVSMADRTEKGRLYADYGVIFVTAVCLLVILAVGIYPQPLISILSKSVMSVF